MCYALVGANRFLEFSESNKRLVFLGEYGSIRSLPILHYNTMNFDHMRSRDYYLMFRQIDDKFIALDRQNKLVTWDMLNGELLSESLFEGCDFL